MTGSPTLPNASAEHLAPAEGSADDASTRSDWLRILHVEDNPADALLAQEYIRGSMSAVEFDSASRLSELTVERATSADCALLDLSLPDAAGLGALVALRALAGDLPIIVLTGFDEFELGLAALRNGADDFLIKNHVDGFTLSRAVRYAIERRKLMAEAVSAAVNAGFESSAARTDPVPEPARVLPGTPNVSERIEAEPVAYAPVAREDLLTPSEAAALLYVDPKTVTRWAKAGKFTSFRTPGGHRRFVKSEILAFVSDSTDRPTHRLAFDLANDAATAVVAEAIAIASRAHAEEVAKAKAVNLSTGAVLEDSKTGTPAADNAARTAVLVQRQAHLSASRLSEETSGVASKVADARLAEIGHEAALAALELAATVRAVAVAQAEEAAAAAASAASAVTAAAAKVASTTSAAALAFETEVAMAAAAVQVEAMATDRQVATDTDARASGSALVTQVSPTLVRPEG